MTSMKRALGDDDAEEEMMLYGPREGGRVLQLPVEDGACQWSFSPTKQNKRGRESRERMVERCRPGETLFVGEEREEGREDNRKRAREREKSE